MDTVSRTLRRRPRRFHRGCGEHPISLDGANFEIDLSAARTPLGSGVTGKVRTSITAPASRRTGVSRFPVYLIMAQLVLVRAGSFVATNGAWTPGVSSGQHWRRSRTSLPPAGRAGRPGAPRVRRDSPQTRPFLLTDAVTATTGTARRRGGPRDVRDGPGAGRRGEHRGRNIDPAAAPLLGRRRFGTSTRDATAQPARSGTETAVTSLQAHRSRLPACSRCGRSGLGQRPTCCRRHSPPRTGRTGRASLAAFLKTRRRRTAAPAALVVAGPGACSYCAVGAVFSSTFARTAPTPAMPAAPSRAAANPLVSSTGSPTWSAPNAAATAVIAASPRAEPNW